MNLREHYQQRGAERYDRAWGTFTNAMLMPTIALTMPYLLPGKRLLDVGCGTGVLLDKLLGEQPNLAAWGTDASVFMLNQAQRRLGERACLMQWNLDQAAPERIQQAAPFDVITCTSVTHYLVAPTTTLHMLTALLAPAGMLLLSDFVRHGWWWPGFEFLLHAADAQHRETFTAEQLSQFLQQAGLRVVTQQSFAAGGPWLGATIVGQRATS